MAYPGQQYQNSHASHQQYAGGPDPCALETCSASWLISADQSGQVQDYGRASACHPVLPSVTLTEHQLTVQIFLV